MTSTYVVLLHSHEDLWTNADEDLKARVRDAHVTFAREMTAAGHRIVGGEELQRSATAVVVRADGDGFETSEGPYTETVEQIGGFYLVATDDVADVARLAAPLAYHDGSAVEIRPIVDHSADLDLGARAQTEALA
jgi:hypothetical protein